MHSTSAVTRKEHIAEISPREDAIHIVHVLAEEVVRRINSGHPLAIFPILRRLLDHATEMGRTNWDAAVWNPRPGRVRLAMAAAFTASARHLRRNPGILGRDDWQIEAARQLEYAGRLVRDSVERLSSTQYTLRTFVLDPQPLPVLN